MPTVTLTPQDEVDAYASISVTLPTGTFDVSITKYRCSNTAFGKDAAHGGTQDAVVFKDKVLGASKNAILGVLSAPAFVGVFVGKGSRDDIVTVLQWVDQLKLLDPKLPKQAALQKICDDYIGLDCNGFVGNWAIENAVPKMGPNIPPISLGAAVAANKRMALDEIQPYDILVWNAHVAAVDSVGEVTGSGRSAQLAAMVGEAYGAIMCQSRTIKNGSGAGCFKVSGHDWAECQVYGTGLTPQWVRATPLPLIAPW